MNGSSIGQKGMSQASSMAGVKISEDQGVQVLPDQKRNKLTPGQSRTYDVPKTPPGR